MLTPGVTAGVTAFPRAGALPWIFPARYLFQLPQDPLGGAAPGGGLHGQQQGGLLQVLLLAAGVFQGAAGLLQGGVVGLAEELVGGGVHFPAGEEGFHIGDGEHLFQQAEHNEPSQVFFAVLFLFRVGDEAVFHIVVDHGAGEQAGLALWLEEAQALGEVEDDLVHIEGDGGQVVPSGEGFSLPGPCPGGNGRSGLFVIHRVNLLSSGEHREALKSF